MRVAIGELFQETCAFSTRHTTREDFQFTPAEELFGAYEDTESEIGGFLDVFQQESDFAGGLEPAPVCSARMMPGAGGPVTDDTYEYYVETFLERLGALDPAGVVLAMHGSMMTPTRQDPEGEFLDRIREQVGDVPVVASLDHHAYVTERMLDALDALVGYTTHPHTDVRETGRRAARLFASTALGTISPRIAMCKAPMTSATRTETDREPMSAIFELRKRLETETDCVSVSFFPTHCWIDVDSLGFTAVAVADDDPDPACEAVRELAELAWKRRQDFHETLPTISEAVDDLFETDGNPVVFSDRGDITLGGAPGDSPVILRELLERTDTTEVRAAVPIVDPEAVEDLADRVGETVRIAVGGKSTPVFDSVDIEGVVVRTDSDPFAQEGTYYDGASFDIGRRVVVRTDSPTVSVVLLERPPLTTHPTFFSSHGIDVSEQDLLVVKSAGHFRPNFEDLAADIVTVDTPGACPVSLSRCPYERARPLYPVDESSFTPDVYVSE